MDLLGPDTSGRILMADREAEIRVAEFQARTELSALRHLDRTTSPGRPPSTVTLRTELHLRATSAPKK